MALFPLVPPLQFLVNSRGSLKGHKGGFSRPAPASRKRPLSWHFALAQVIHGKSSSRPCSGTLLIFHFFIKVRHYEDFFSPSFHHSLCQPRSCLFSCFLEGTAEGSSHFGILHKYLNRFWYFVITSAVYDISTFIQYWPIVTPGPQYNPIAIQMDCLPFLLSSEQLLRTSTNERNVKDVNALIMHIS